MNPQFTCLSCPCAAEVETHEVIDDRGDPYYLVDAVGCGFEGESRRLSAVEQRFPSLLAGVVENAPPRVELGVSCPLLSWSGRSAPVSLEIEGTGWVPVGNCRSCQFYRGIEGSPRAGFPEGESGQAVVCAAPLPSSSP